MYILQNALFYKLSFQKTEQHKSFDDREKKTSFIKFVLGNLISLPVKVMTVLLTMVWPKYN